MKLHELNIADKHVFNCLKIEVTELVMIYYKPKECGLEFCDDKNGFDFCVVQTESYPIDHEDIIWTSSEEHEVKIVCEGYGFWDGIRHLRWYPEEDGYVNYPDMSLIEKVCNGLMFLEKKYCTESEWFDDERPVGDI